MSDSNKPKSKNVSEWIDDISLGKVGKPRWQRGYVWDRKRIEKLLLSIVKRRPIGTLLTIRLDPKKNTFSVLPLHQSEVDTEKLTQLVLDGQQRISSIWLAISGNHPDYEFYFEFDPNKAITFDSIREVVSYKRSDRKRPQSAKDEIDRHLVPVRLFRRSIEEEGLDPISDWGKSIYPFDTDSYIDIYKRLSEIGRELTYQEVFYFELDQDTDYNQAIDIFVETNRTAKVVSSFDIAVAKFDVRGEEGFRELLENIDIDADRKRRFFGYTQEIQVTEIGEVVLKAACVFNKQVPTAGNIERPGTTKLIRNSWSEFVDGINQTLMFLEDEAIWDKRRLPRDIPLRVLPPLFVKNAAIFQNASPAQKLQLYRILRLWLWRGLLTERYDRDANRRLLEDYNELNRLIELTKSPEFSSNVLKSTLFGGVDVSSETITTLDDPIEAPTSNSALAKSIFAITLRGSPYDFASGVKITSKNVGSKEYHHLFPKSRGREFRNLPNDVDIKKALNHPLNFALLEEGSNKTLSNKDPKDYLKERLLAAKMSDAEMSRYLEQSLIPYSALNVAANYENYEKFIRERGTHINIAASQLLLGEDWRPVSIGDY